MQTQELDTPERNGDERCRRFSIRLLFYVTTVVAMACSACVTAPSFGFLYAFDVLCTGYLFASFSKIPGLWPFRERLGIIDLLTLIVVCGILHGMQIPSVST